MQSEFLGSELNLLCLLGPWLLWVVEGSITHHILMNNASDGSDGVLADADIQEFIRIYQEEFRETITPKAAREMAAGVLELYRALTTPSSREFKKESSDLNKVQPPKTSAKRVIDIVPP